MNEEETPLYMSNAEIDRLRGIKRRTYKHGTNIRAAFFWLIIAGVLLGYPLYMRVAGIGLWDVVTWIVSSLGFILALIALLALCGEWRKEE